MGAGFFCGTESKVDPLGGASPVGWGLGGADGEGGEGTEPYRSRSASETVSLAALR